MPAETVMLEVLLEPISVETPTGTDVRLSSDWRRIENARRSDDELEQGAWQAAERKTANWSQVLEISAKLLKEKTKDLRLAMFLVEAMARTDGFCGLAKGLHFAGELLTKYWDAGLHPLPEQSPNGADGLADRAKALAWLNDKLTEVVGSLPITFASPPAPNYSYTRYLSARKVGREKDHERDAAKEREKFTEAKEMGLCLDDYDSAVRTSPLALLENLYSDIQASTRELTNIEKAVNEKFGDSKDSPGFSELRNALMDVSLLVEIGLKGKRPKTSPSGPASAKIEPPVAPSTSPPTGLPDPHLGGVVHAKLPFSSADLGPAWEEAQSMVRSGQIERGLAAMGHLAQRETSGRDRFQRKLVLAEVCLKNRPRLAKTILEELAEQIDKYKLDEWETTDVVGGVWTRLYRIYVENNETERASQLYGRLCHLDPWQTLSCSED